MPGITLLGLGPGRSDLLTREAWRVLSSADDVWLRTAQHPSVAGLPSSLAIHSFDDIYEVNDLFDETYKEITQRVLQLGRQSQGVIYAVPGHPFIAEATCPEIARLARAEGLEVSVVEGISFLEPTFSALGADPFPRMTVCDALTLGRAHVPLFASDSPVLIAQIYSRLVASEVKVVLNAIYPDRHAVRLVHAAGTVDQTVEELELFEIDRSEHTGALTCLYVPALGEGTSLEALQEVVAHLRAPEGCPWDREQTHETLRRHLLEETYEVLAAMDTGDFHAMREELGDLLLQIMLNAQIASEEGEFSANDVIKGIYDKIIRRHPHVFAAGKVEGVEDVLANWERVKAGERQQKSAPGGALEGIPDALPALSTAQAYQERAARFGFDWPEIQGVLDKIGEEIQEVRDAGSSLDLPGELGDLLFALVNLARWKNVDAEFALRATNTKFKKRFGFVERGAQKQGRSLSGLSLDEMERLWRQAKDLEG